MALLATCTEVLQLVRTYLPFGAGNVVESIQGRVGKSRVPLTALAKCI